MYTVNKCVVLCFLVVLLSSAISVAQEGELWQLTFDDVSAGHPAWSPDGSQIAFESERSGNADIWIIPAAGGTPVQITTDPADDTQPDWSPDGQTLVFCSYRSDDDGDIWTYHLPTSTLTRLTTYSGSDWTARWSPDGTSIAFVSDRGGSLDIWTMSPNGDNYFQVTDDPGTEWGPAWSPDGSLLAFVGFMSGNNDLWIVDSQGANPPQQVTNYTGHDLLPSWSPDGSTLAFGSDRGGSLDIWTIPVTGGTAAQLTFGSSQEANPCWSPDGSRIAFESNQDGTFDVWVLLLSRFKRITEGPHVTSGGLSWSVNWIDYDNDDYVDLFVSNIDTDNALYHNNQDGTFTEVLGEELADNPGGIASAGASWSDYNNDGYPDLFIATYREGSPPVNRAFTNNGDGTFTRITEGAIVSQAGMSIEPSWVDYDSDGLLDLYVANHEANYLYRQDDTGFAIIISGPLVAEDAGSNSACWADYDCDGYQDLFVTNGWVDPDDRLFTNNGDGSFDEVLSGSPAESPGVSMGGSWGDYDNDGDFDLFVTQYVWGSPATSYDSLFRNNGDGTFTSLIGIEPNLHGGYSCGATWGDFDNDGDVDLFVAVEGPNFLYDNAGDGTFTLVTEGEIATDSRTSNGCAAADYDRDGFLDLFVTNVDQDNDLYRNNGNNNHWIDLRCVGSTSNRSAIGTKVQARAVINGEPLRQTREISSKTGKNGQNSLNVHFGLGDATVIDSISINWPSGITQVLTDVAVDQFLTVTESCCGAYTGGYTGNVNCDIEGKRNLADISKLIDRVYISKTPLCCEANGNVNGDIENKVNLADISRLIDHVYIGKTETAACE